MDPTVDDKDLAGTLSVNAFAVSFQNGFGVDLGCKSVAVVGAADRNFESLREAYSDWNREKRKTSDTNLGSLLCPRLPALKSLEEDSMKNAHNCDDSTALFHYHYADDEHKNQSFLPHMVHHPLADFLRKTNEKRVHGSPRRVREFFVTENLYKMPLDFADAQVEQLQ